MSGFDFTMIVAFFIILFWGCGIHFMTKDADKLQNLGILFLTGGTIIIIVVCIVVTLAPLDKVEINRKYIAIESIDAYNLNDYQQYKITTEDGTVYDTALTSLDELMLFMNNNFVSVEESEDNEFHLYNITYQKQKNIISLTVTDGESTKLVFEVPHEYYVLHTGEQDNNMTRVYTSNE